MSDDLRDTPPTPPASPGNGKPTAGSLLRQAREAQGLHVAALAIQLKVPPRKLEALEADRHEELLDSTFTRALALAVCRALKIDSAPVLALLPRRPLDDLSPVAGGGLNTPFKGGATRLGESRLRLSRGVLLAVGAIALAALAVALAPADFGARQLEQWRHTRASSPWPASAAETPQPTPSLPASSLAIEAAATLAAVPTPAQTASAAAAAASAPVSAGLTLTAIEASWVQVLDGDARPLLIRQLAAGETATVDSAPPLRLIIGNAAGTRVTWQGQPVDLVPRTRDNVARLEITATP